MIVLSDKCKASMMAMKMRGMLESGIIMHDKSIGTCTITEEGIIQFWEVKGGKLCPRKGIIHNAN